MTPEVNRSELIEHILQETGIGKEYKAVGEEATRMRMEGFSNSTLLLIARTVAWNKNQGDSKTAYMYSSLSQREKLVRSQMFQRLMFTRPVSTATALESIQGLGYKDYFKDMSKVEEVTGHDLEVARAILNVTVEILLSIGGRSSSLVWQGTSGSATYLSDDDFSDLVIAHPDKIDEIVSFVKEYRSTDAQHLRSYLDNGTALAAGVL